MVSSSQLKQRLALSKALHAVVFRWGPKLILVCSGQNSLEPHM